MMLYQSVSANSGAGVPIVSPFEEGRRGKIFVRVLLRKLRTSVTGERIEIAKSRDFVLHNFLLNS